MEECAHHQVEERRHKRKRQRATPSLHEKVLTPGLHQQYQGAAMRVMRFWRHSGTMPTTWDDIDVATSRWLEHNYLCRKLS